jgi:hypothetical protein
MQIYDSYMTDRLLAPPNPTSVGARSNRSDRAEERVSSALACPDANLGGESWFVNLGRECSAAERERDAQTGVIEMLCGPYR